VTKFCLLLIPNFSWVVPCQADSASSLGCRMKGSFSMSKVQGPTLTRATLTGPKPVHRVIIQKKQQATVLEHSHFLPSSGTSIDQPYPTSGLELSALQSNPETGARELEAALNDPLVRKLRQVGSRFVGILTSRLGLVVGLLLQKADPQPSRRGYWAVRVGLCNCWV
jgi:hypothetical protein